MIKLFKTIPDISKNIRHKVFIEEQGFSYDEDEIDKIATHVIYYHNDIPIGVCRYFLTDNTKNYHLGRFAILKEFRNKNHGRKMLELVIKQIQNENGEKIIISSQLNAINFYLKSNFKIISELYYEQHCPHKDMELILKKMY